MIKKIKLLSYIEQYKKIMRTRIQGGEIFKWEAVQCFQDNWDIDAEDFGEMFKRAVDKTGSILRAGRFFPIPRIQWFAEYDRNTTRQMFIDLFDETNDLAERAEHFIDESSKIMKILCEQEYENRVSEKSFQNTNSISVYLWLMYPEKYYIYKYSAYKKVAELLEADTKIAMDGKPETMIAGFAMYDEIRAVLLADKELRSILDDVLADIEYRDTEFRTLTIDFGFWLATEAESSNDDSWYGADYNPGITVDDWVKLLKNKDVFTESSLAIMKRMKDIGGIATCTQLAEKYGETVPFYNFGSVNLAKRVCKEMGIPGRKLEMGAEEWITVLYTGRYAKEDETGYYTWRLRDELSQALDMVDLSDIPLYADRTKTVTTSTDDIRYWLYAPGTGASYWEEFCSLGIMGLGWEEIGDLRTYPDKEAIRKKMVEVYEEEGSYINSVLATWQFANEIKPGDIIYAKKGRSTIVGRGIVTSGYIFDKSRSEQKNIRRVNWTHKGHWQLSTQGIMKTLTDITAYRELLAEIESFFANITTSDYSSYTSADFLHDVYMTQAEYETLSRLLLKKKNVILQGAPGVGKTFASKRLAYSIMGCKDESRIEFIQFHQSYSYEDFIMGYRPCADGSFALCEGVFYKFCKKAEADPERDYFFIIDEINRGNLSKIFGELLMLTESDKRGASGYSVKLTYRDELFSVPKNLYIIGMMNTADRSLAIIDYALRRRFSFFDMRPGFDSKGFSAYAETLESSAFNNLVDTVKALNREIAGDPALGEGFCIGHSYLCNLTKESASVDDLQAIIDYDIVPLLREYWFDDKEKADNWCIKLHNAIGGR